MQRSSKNRQSILECLRGTKEHPSAEWIYGQIKPKHPNLSLATVYRNLNQLKAEGLVRSMGSVDGQERFDADMTPHAHAICARCGKITDVAGVHFPEELAEQVAAATGYEIRRQDLQFSGICEECLKRSAQ